jgi:hypothetical protein
VIGTIALSVWVGGIIGGATIAVASGENKGWTVAGGLATLAVWPFWLFAISLYGFFGAKMGEMKP